jgi:multisubunit Na+/H+ antiporter MnhC subunit
MISESLKLGLLMWFGLFVFAIYAELSRNILALGALHFGVTLLVVITGVMIPSAVVGNFINKHYNSSIRKRKGDGEEV